MVVILKQPIDLKFLHFKFNFSIDAQKIILKKYNYVSTCIYK